MNENDSAAIEFNDRLQEVMEFRSTLSEETDRGCALMAASFLDEQLRELLEMCLVDDPEKEKFLGPQSPLGSFSARITAAFLLGKISKLAFRDLNLIRKIRNKFGHTSRPIRFSDEPIKDLCREFHYCSRDQKDDPRKRFTNTVLGVLSFIHASAVGAQTLPVKEEVEPSSEDVEKAATRVNELVKRELQKIEELYQNDVHRLVDELKEGRLRELEND
jgi:DNA-binding MltR family transcriptional regulator